jgi:hypothetical protein
VRRRFRQRDGFGWMSRVSVARGRAEQADGGVIRIARMSKAVRHSLFRNRRFEEKARRFSVLTERLLKLRCYTSN